MVVLPQAAQKLLCCWSLCRRYGETRWNGSKSALKLRAGHRRMAAEHRADRGVRPGQGDRYCGVGTTAAACRRRTSRTLSGQKLAGITVHGRRPGLGSQQGIQLGGLMCLKGLVRVGVRAGEDWYVEAGAASSTADFVCPDPAVACVPFPYQLHRCGDCCSPGRKVGCILVAETATNFDVDAHCASSVVPPMVV